MTEKEKRAIKFIKYDMFKFEEIDSSVLEEFNNVHKIILNLIKKQQKEMGSMQMNYEAKIDKMEYEMGYDYISKDVIKKEIKKLNEKNGIAFDMDTGQILKTKEDYQIAILKKLLRRK